MIPRKKPNREQNTFNHTPKPAVKPRPVNLMAVWRKNQDFYLEDLDQDM